MDVLFKNIPLGITAFELADFIESSIHKKSICNDGIHISINSIDMLEIQDNFTHPVEQFGIVRFSSSKIATKVIQLLNDHVLNQYQITVREYFIRSAENNRRVKSIDSFDDFLDKREKDRRINGRLLVVRQENNRLQYERRLEDWRFEEKIEIDNRVKERRKQDRRKQNLVYSRRI